jgi:type IV pilus assembly protein PilO
MAGSSSEILERLARQSPAVKLGLLGGVLVVLTLGYYYFFHSDMVTEKETLGTAKKKLVEDERRLLKRKNDYQELLKQKADAEERLKQNAVKLPESAEIPAFFQHLETQAATANVRIVSRTTEKEVPVESYVKVPVKLEVQGDFYQLNHYFYLLAETNRITTIENLSIGDPKRDGDRIVMTAKFTAATFRQSDRPAQAVAPPSAPAATPPTPTPNAGAPPAGSPPAAVPAGVTPSAAPAPAPSRAPSNLDGIPSGKK